MESEIKLSFATIIISTQKIGNDILITIKGGDKWHIGTAVLAVPRLSLTGDGTMSSTSSVLNVTGHKDEILCRMLAEKISKKYGVNVVCTGGFHVDNMSHKQIEEVVDALQEFTKSWKISGLEMML